MPLVKRMILSLVAVALLLAALAWAFQRQVGTLMLERIARQNVGRNIVPDLPDGLHLALCGTGSPFPDPSRAGPCSVVIAGQRIFVIDAGEGAGRNLGYMGIPTGKVEALFLTHFHSDHIDGMGPILLQHWGLASAAAPLPVYGPTGVEKVVDGFRAAYVLDYGYRVSHHTEKIMPTGGSGGKSMPFELPVKGQGDTVVVMDDSGLKVTAFRVNHAPVEPAVGYRFDYQGRSIVISGDTTKVAALIAISKDADILLHEALQPKLVALLGDAFTAKKMDNLAHVMRDILTYHTTPEEAAQEAQEAGVKHLVFNHIVPPMPVRFGYPAFVGDAAQFYKGPITVGEDGMLFSLPARSSEVIKKRLM